MFVEGLGGGLPIEGFAGSTVECCGDSVQAPYPAPGENQQAGADLLGPDGVLAELTKMLLCFANRFSGVGVVWAFWWGGLGLGRVLGVWWGVFEESVEVAGDVPFEAASCFAGGFSLGGAFGYVGLGFGTVAGAGDGDVVDCSMLLFLSNREHPRY